VQQMVAQTILHLGWIASSPPFIWYYRWVDRAPNGYSWINQCALRPRIALCLDWKKLVYAKAFFSWHADMQCHPIAYRVICATRGVSQLCGAQKNLNILAAVLHMRSQRRIVLGTKN
jgi:hypothetical protein